MISPTYPHYIPIAIIHLWYSHDSSPVRSDPSMIPTGCQELEDTYTHG